MPDWIDEVVAALIRTWDMAPLERRWTLGTIVVVSLVASQWVIPALGDLVRAFRVKVDQTGVFQRKDKR